MAPSEQAADRVERFLDTHPDGRLVVCVGSASVAGIVWLAERTRRRPVTLLIGDLKSRNFAKATDADRRAALEFVGRSDVGVRNWYRTQRSGQGRSEAHLKVWAACDAHDTPQAFLVGSANLTIAGLQENVELMALADATEHPYLRQTIHELQDKSWDAKERLAEWIEGDDAPESRHHPRDRRSERTPSASGRKAPATSTGCGTSALAAATGLMAAVMAAAAVAILLIKRGQTSSAMLMLGMFWGAVAILLIKRGQTRC